MAKQPDMTPGTMKAVWLYFLLPEAVRRKVNSFLSPAEQGELLKRSKDRSQAGMKLEKSLLFKQITHSLKQLAKQGRQGGRELRQTFLGFHLLIHFLVVSLALIEGMNFTAGIVTFYMIGGIIFILQKSSTYLAYRYSPLPFYPQYVIVAALSYTIMTLSVGWLSVNADFPKPDPVTLVVAAFMAPFFEELLFRDVIYNIVEDVAGSSFLAILVGAIFFAMVHFQGDFHMFDMLIYTVSGIILGTLRWATGKLFYPILVHSGVNLTLLLL